MAARLMNATQRTAPQPSFAELFTPKLVTVFREGYAWQHLRADALAGLTVAIVVGFALGSVLFIHRMAQTTAIAAHVPFAEEPDRADGADAERRPYDESLAADPDVVVYRITGAFFFGAAAAIGTVLERISTRHRALIVVLSASTVSRRDRGEHARRSRAQGREAPRARRADGRE